MKWKKKNALCSMQVDETSDCSLCTVPKRDVQLVVVCWLLRTRRMGQKVFAFTENCRAEHNRSL